MSRPLVAMRLPRFSTEYVIPLAMALGALLMVLVPNDLYDRAPLARALTDAVAAVMPSVNEFARVSSVPGTTRVVLATLWLLVIPLAVALGTSTRTFPRRAHELRRAGWRPWLAVIVLVIGLVFVLPHYLKIPRDFRTGLSWDAGFYRFLADHPLAMGLFGGLYCYVSALLLAGLGRSLILVAFASSDPHHRETR